LKGEHGEKGGTRKKRTGGGPKGLVLRGGVASKRRGLTQGDPEKTKKGKVEDREPFFRGDVEKIPVRRGEIKETLPW